MFLDRGEDQVVDERDRPGDDAEDHPYQKSDGKFTFPHAAPFSKMKERVADIGIVYHREHGENKKGDQKKESARIFDEADVGENKQ